MPVLTANGVRLAYELFGESQKIERAHPFDQARSAQNQPFPPIVLLNGIAMSISHWKPMIAELPAGTPCVCHDFRGQTLSDKPAGPYSLEIHADDLAALLDGLGIARGHIVGTSYGSEVAMEFAIKYPERCASLMVIDGVSELDAVLEGAAISWMESAKVDPRVFYKTMQPWTYSSAFISENREMLSAREDGVAALPKAWFNGFVELCKAFLSIDLTSRLQSIKCPTTVIVGENDILKPRHFSEIIARNIHGATMQIIPGAGHAVVIEQPAKIAEAIWKAVSSK
jgi:3-oxoadipate enol-lactonase